MAKMRCSICRYQCISMKTLKAHYLRTHTKLQIIRDLMKTSILQSTPKLLAKTRRFRGLNKFWRRSKQIFLHKDVNITYSRAGILIQNQSDEETIIELTLDNCRSFRRNSKKLALATNSQFIKSIEKPAANKRKSKRTKKPKIHHIDIGIKKLGPKSSQKSLDEQTGQFYQCNCMRKIKQQLPQLQQQEQQQQQQQQKLSSDTESCSEGGKTFYCNYCGNGYGTVNELSEHEKGHLFYCRICGRYCEWQYSKQHVEQHLIKIYVCHMCGYEFAFKEALCAHLNYHFEQQTLENILDMEQDYNVFNSYNLSFRNEDYVNDIGNILFYLTYPHEHYYCQHYFNF